MSSPVGRYLLFNFQETHSLWAGYTPRSGEPAEVSRYERWLLWLALDLSALALAEHLSTEGELETDDRLAKLDCDGRVVVWRDGHDAPLCCPRSSDAAPFTTSPRYTHAA